MIVMSDSERFDDCFVILRPLLAMKLDELCSKLWMSCQKPDLNMDNLDDDERFGTHKRLIRPKST